MMYPQQLNDVFYGLQKQEPSYQSEFPHDIPYDPGTTSSLFELNYFPTTASKLLLLIPIGIVLFLIIFRKRLIQNIGPFWLMSALIVVFFGPIRLPSMFMFNTSLGLVKGLGIGLFLYSILEIIVGKQNHARIFEAPTTLPVITYVISLLLSVFVMTNPTYFMQDFGIVAVGILFYYLSYTYFSWKETHSLLKIWAWLLIFPSAIVLLIFIDQGLGNEVMSLLFLKYDNFVFLHDLSRGRIFSVIDFEYYIPCATLFLVDMKLRLNKKNPTIFYIITSISFAAILLVKYRYRFLTYILGLFVMAAFTKKYARAIRKATFLTFVVLSALYFGYSYVFSQSTIIDRFLVKNYSEDQVSIDRRLVMYRQAIDLFIQRPILGVGLGNYKDNVQIVYSRFGGRTYEPFYKILQNVYAYPHNWFLTVLAEGGIIGFAVLMWLLYRFVRIDLYLYKKLVHDQLLIFIILANISWLYVFANFFTMMHVSLPIVIVFWACRGMIERIYHERFAPSEFVMTKRLD